MALRAMAIASLPQGIPDIQVQRTAENLPGWDQWLRDPARLRGLGGFEYASPTRAPRLDQPLYRPGMRHSAALQRSVWTRENMALTVGASAQIPAISHAPKDEVALQILGPGWRPPELPPAGIAETA